MKKTSIQKRKILKNLSLKKFKRFKKIKNNKKLLRKLLQGVSKNNLNSFKKSLVYKRVYLAQDFRMSVNPEGVTRKINEIVNNFKNKKPVFIMMTKVTQIDYSALAALLSVMYKFKKSKIDFDGNFPIDKDVKRQFGRSGFFDKLFENQTDKTIYYVNAENQFITQGDNFFFDLNLVDEHIIPAVAQTVWGKEKRIPGLRSTLLELIDNTKTHASGQEGVDERWWISINHDHVNKKVSFVFLDYGIGIFTSLNSKNDKVAHYFKFLKRTHGETEHDVHLKALLEFGQESVTGEANRGKGIRGIKLSSERKQIDKLQIITNNAFALVNKDKYIKMAHNFDGTLFYWEIGYSNVNFDPV